MRLHGGALSGAGGALCGPGPEQPGRVEAPTASAPPPARAPLQLCPSSTAVRHNPHHCAAGCSGNGGIPVARGAPTPRDATLEGGKQSRGGEPPLGALLACASPARGKRARGAQRRRGGQRCHSRAGRNRCGPGRRDLGASGPALRRLCCRNSAILLLLVRSFSLRALFARRQAG